MKQLLKKAKRLQEQIEIEVHKRNEFFLGKSDKWQESESGEDYQNKTDSLKELSDMIDEGLSNFEPL